MQSQLNRFGPACRLFFTTNAYKLLGKLFWSTAHVRETRSWINSDKLIWKQYLWGSVKPKICRTHLRPVEETTLPGINCFCHFCRGSLLQSRTRFWVASCLQGDLGAAFFTVSEFGPRNILTLKCMSTEPSVYMGILLSNRHPISTTQSSMRPSSTRGTCWHQGNISPHDKEEQGNCSAWWQPGRTRLQAGLFMRRHILLPRSAAASLTPSLAPHSWHSWTTGSSRTGPIAENMASGNDPGLQLKPAPPLYRKDIESQSAKKKVKNGWREEDSPFEREALPAVNGACNRHLRSHCWETPTPKGRKQT